MMIQRCSQAMLQTNPLTRNTSLAETLNLHHGPRWKRIRPSIHLGRRTITAAFMRFLACRTELSFWLQRLLADLLGRRLVRSGGLL